MGRQGPVEFFVRNFTNGTKGPTIGSLWRKTLWIYNCIFAIYILDGQKELSAGEPTIKKLGWQQKKNIKKLFYSRHDPAYWKLMELAMCLMSHLASWPIPCFSSARALVGWPVFSCLEWIGEVLWITEGALLIARYLLQLEMEWV